MSRRATNRVVPICRVALICSLMAGGSLAALLLVHRAYFPTLPSASAEVMIGATLPEISLPDEQGRPILLASLRGHPSVILFYRGGFCPSCRAQLTALAERAPPFIAKGVRVVGISADPPSLSAKWKSTLGLPFPLLSDEEQRLAPALCNANAHCLVLLDRSGVICWGELNDNWRNAVKAETILQAAYRLLQGRGALGS
jgi:peroxiredoxin